MRTFTAAVLVLLLAVLPAGANESSEPLGEEYQVTSGTVALPTRFTNPEQGYPGLGRRLWLAASATNGAVAHVFTVDPETWGGAFELGGVTDATGEGDLGIYFYSDFGGLEPLAGPHDPISTAEYDTRNKGGEAGFIPFGSEKALVFTYNAVNAAFTYRGFTMPTVNLAGGSLDLTVPAGAFVGWRNNTGDYSYVRHLATKPQFNSSPGVATGLGNGEVFTHQFNSPGTYAYETSTGQGTITVVDGPGPGTPAS